MHLKNYIIVLAVVGMSNSSPISSDSNPIVETEYGLVQGYTETGINGRQFYAFKSIPFAKPPVGNLRFRAPQKPDNWTGILDATNNPPICIQRNYLLDRPVEGTEDCLYINVYVPKDVDDLEPLPVMVFIFYGGFFSGYSTPDIVGPNYFMEEGNVILVTFNYRVGALGFLSTDDDNAPGNYGLKDQSLALKWVQANIENFSGDKNRVTIFGQSSGSGSVHYHMLSPLSKNLFHRAISQSGTALAIWGKFDGPIQRSTAEMQGQFVNCTNTQDTADLIECLREVPAYELVASGDLFKTFAIDPLVQFLPSIENETEANPEPFITKSAAEYINDNEFMKVPWILGITQGEGRLRAQALITQEAIREALNEDFDSKMEYILLLSGSNSNATLLWEEMKNFYLDGKTRLDLNDSSMLKGFVNLYSDRLFAYNPYQAARLHSLRGHEDIWFYNFNYTGQYSFGPLFAPGGETIDYNGWEASHCDDLIYLFDSPGLFDQLSDSRDIIVKEFMTKKFIKFAKFGNPNGNQSTNTWPKVSDNDLTFNNLRYLDIAGDWKTSSPEFRVKEGLNEERWGFLEQLPLAENLAVLGENYYAFN